MPDPLPKMEARIHRRFVTFRQAEHEVNLAPIRLANLCICAGQAPHPLECRGLAAISLKDAFVGPCETLPINREFLFAMKGCPY